MADLRDVTAEKKEELFVLPLEITPAYSQNPKRLVIISHPKVGKTTVVSKLENNLIIDLEDSSDYVSGLKINIKKEARKLKIDSFEMVGRLIKSLEKACKESSDGYAYDYITIDTTTALESIARELGTRMYKNSNQGKNFTGSDVTVLAKGSGYAWLRLAFDKLYSKFKTFPRKSLILLGHVKLISAEKDGKELEIQDINLTGKLKTMLCEDADATGFMYRDKHGNNVISFKTSEYDRITGSRSNHLANEEIIISERTEDGNIITHWDKIFI